MSIPQGSTDYNAGYGNEVLVRIPLAVNCSQLNQIYSQAVLSLNATSAAITSQYNAIVAELAQTEADALNLYNQIATIAGWETAQTALTAQLGYAATLTADPTAIVAYLQAQATVMISLNSATLATLVKELIALNSAYTTLNNDITTLNARVSTLAAQIAAIPATISAIESAAATAAANFHGCTLSL